MGDPFGWIGLVVAQIASWPQVLKLRRARGEGISLLTYGLWLVCMSFCLVHALVIRDTVTVASLSLLFVPNLVVAAILVRRRTALGRPPASSGRTFRAAGTQVRRRPGRRHGRMGPRRCPVPLARPARISVP